MRVIIVALDGLDYYLAVKWKLRDILQKQYHRFKISEHYYHEKEKVPYSPKIWSSFLTGLPPDQHNVRSWWEYHPLLEKIRHFPIIRHVPNKRRVLWKLGIKGRIVKVKSSTLIDDFDESCVVWFPGYNDSTELHERLSKAFYKGLKEYEREIWRVHRERRERTFKMLRTKWKLFMTYFDLADLLGHIYLPKRLYELKIAYLRLNKLVYRMKREIDRSIDVDENYVFLIVSDHGMREDGRHSDYAFYSLNFENPKIVIDDFTEFRELIKRLSMDESLHNLMKKEYR